MVMMMILGSLRPCWESWNMQMLLCLLSLMVSSASILLRVLRAMVGLTTAEQLLLIA